MKDKYIWIYRLLLVLLACNTARAESARFGEALRTDNAKGTVAVKFSSIQTEAEIIAQALNFHGTLLAIRAGSQKIEILDVNTRAYIKSINLPDGANDIDVALPLQFTADGRYLMSCHTRTASSEVSTFWNAKTWIAEKKLDDPLLGNGCTALIESKTGNEILRLLTRPIYRPGPTIVAHDKSLGVSRRDVRTAPLEIKNAAIDPEGKYLAITGKTMAKGDKSLSGANEYSGIGREAGGVLAIVNTETLKPISWIHFVDSIFPRSSIAWCRENLVYYTSGHKINALKFPKLDPVLVFENPDGSQYAQLACAAQGKYLVELMLGKPYGHVQIWNSEHTNLLQTIEGNYRTISISGDGKTIGLSHGNAIDFFRIDN